MAPTGTFEVFVGALLSCTRRFNETGRRLDERGRPDHELYAEWIETYSSEEFTELTEWCKALIDEVAAGRPARDRQRYRWLFRTSMRYEYRFWDAA